MKRAFISLLLLSGLAAMSQTNEPVKSAFSLNDAVSYALQNNNGTKNARLDYLATKKKALEVITFGLPQVNSSAEYDNYFQLPVQLIPGEFFGAPGTSYEVKFGKPHNFKAGLDASQLIFDARFIIGVQARKDLVAASGMAITKSEIDTRKSVITAYYGALVSQESYNLIRTNLTVLEKLLSDTKALYKEGFAEELDVQRLELSLANLRSAVKDVENKSVNAKNNLKYQMGISQDQEIELTENLDAILKQVQPEEVHKFDPANRIEFSLLNAQKTLLGYDVKQKNAGYYPSIYAFANYSANAQRDKFNFTNDGRWYRTGIWGVQVKFPLFDGMNRYAVIEQAKIKKVQAMNDLENFKQASQLQVSVTQNNFTHALDQLNDAKQNLTLAQKIQTKSMIMFKEGVGSSLALAQSDADLVTAQLNYIQAVYNYLNSKTELDVALGKLN